MTDVRTVKRWEGREVNPTMRHQWFLRLFALYVRERGLKAFRLRFAGKDLRYRKPGRPAVPCKPHTHGARTGPAALACYRRGRPRRLYVPRVRAVARWYVPREARALAPRHAIRATVPTDRRVQV
jgi:hypothetical protein